MKRLRITVGDNTYDVTVEILDDPPSQQPVHQAAAASSGLVAPIASAPPAPKSGAIVPGAVLSPMAGVIKAVSVQAGSQVEPGQVLILLEAMKLENRITAPAAGTVKQVHVKVGDSVGEGDLLLELE